MNHQESVIAHINESIPRIRVFFSTDLREEYFKDFVTHFATPGYSVRYGTNTVLGGIDRSIVDIHYNETHHYKGVAKQVESVLQGLRFNIDQWQRAVDRQTLRSTNLEGVC